MQEPKTPERTERPQDSGNAAVLEADGASPATHSRRRTELMQQKIAEEFKVKSQQVHEDISQIRQETFKQIASSRALPASAAFEKIQDHFKGAAMEFEEAQRIKRQQQFEEVAGIRRRRACSLPPAVQQPATTESQPKLDTETARKEIKSSGRKSVREIASAFQGASLPQTMEAFLQAYVQQQAVHRRAGSNSWQLSATNGRSGRRASESSVDVNSAVAELKAMTEQQKTEMLARFVDIRRTHGLETSALELDSLRKTLMMDETTATSTSAPPPPTRTPPSSPVGSEAALTSPTDEALQAIEAGSGSASHEEDAEAPRTPPQSPNGQHYTPVLNFDDTQPTPALAPGFDSSLPRVPSNPPGSYQQQSPSQDTAEISGGDYVGNNNNSPRRQEGGRTLSIHSTSTCYAVLGEDAEHNDQESQMSVSVDTTLGVHHTEGSTLSRSVSADERTSATTTTAGAVFGESAHIEGADSYDVEAATDANTVLVPEVAVHQAEIHQRKDGEDSTPAQRKRFWCC